MYKVNIARRDCYTNSDRIAIRNNELNEIVEAMKRRRRGNTGIMTILKINMYNIYVGVIKTHRMCA